MVGNPFLKAMEISKGTVSILEKECVAYSRIRCIYELFKSWMVKKYDYKNVYREHDWEVNEKLSNGEYFKDNGDAIGLIDGFIDCDIDRGDKRQPLRQGMCGVQPHLVYL